MHSTLRLEREWQTKQTYQKRIPSVKYSLKVFSSPLPSPNNTMKISMPRATVNPAKKVLNLLEQ